MSSTARSRTPAKRSAAERPAAPKPPPGTPPPKNAHIVAIRRGDVIEGHQLRIGGGGPGMSKFFSSNKFGGPDKARRAALKMIKDLGLPKPGKRGGSAPGRLLKTSTTPAAGIRFLWSQGRDGPLLRVAATWMDKRGRPRHTSFSVERNGVEQALDLAIERRTSAGAPMPDRAALLKALRATKRAGPPRAQAAGPISAASARAGR